MKRPIRRGEYERPAGSGGEPSSVIFGRRYFLEAAVRLEPEILRSLKEVEKRHHAVAKELSPTELRDYLSNNAAAPTQRQRRYFQAVAKWAQRWHLDTDWCRKYALVTLWSWRNADSQHWCFHDDGVWEPKFETLKPRWPDIYPWDPVRQARGEYVAEAMMAAKAALESYCGRVEAEARVRGLKKTVNKRQQLHFYWLAGFQVRGWSCQQIFEAHGKYRRRTAQAKDEHVERTVEIAVEGLARMIGLTLRPVKDYDRSQTAGKIRRALDAANDPATLLEPFECLTPPAIPRLP